MRELARGIRLAPILAFVFMNWLQSACICPFLTVYLYYRYINDILKCADSEEKISGIPREHEQRAFQNQTD